MIKVRQTLMSVGQRSPITLGTRTHFTSCLAYPPACAIHS